MLKPRALRPGRSHRRRRPRQPVRPRRVRRRRRRAAARSASSPSTTTACSRVTAMPPATPDVRAAAFRAGLDRPVDRGADRRPRRLRQRPAAAAARSAARSAARRRLHRLQRQHVAALLAYGCSCGIVSFHGPMLEGRLAGARPATIATRSRASCARRTGREHRASAVETLRAGRSRRDARRRHADAARGLARHAVCFRPAGRHSCSSTKSPNARTASIGMLTQLRLPGCSRARRGVVFGEMPRCDEPDGGAGDPRRRRRSARGLSGPVLFGLPSGHTDGAA